MGLNNLRIMCLILDTNKYGDFLNPKNENMKPVKAWLENRGGKMVYSPTSKMKAELNKSMPEMRKRIDYYIQEGIAIEIDKNRVEKEKEKLTDLKSDDPHIIALAIVSGAKLLVSSDRKLHKDFKGSKVKGSVYQKKGQIHLLSNAKCKKMTQ